jgi:hypothetical protein
VPPLAGRDAGVPGGACDAVGRLVKRGLPYFRSVFAWNVELMQNMLSMDFCVSLLCGYPYSHQRIYANSILPAHKMIEP